MKLCLCTASINIFFCCCISEIVVKSYIDLFEIVLFSVMKLIIVKSFVLFVINIIMKRLKEYIGGGENSLQWRVETWHKNKLQSALSGSFK